MCSLEEEIVSAGNVKSCQDKFILSNSFNVKREGCNGSLKHQHFVSDCQRFKKQLSTLQYDLFKI